RPRARRGPALRVGGRAPGRGARRVPARARRPPADGVRRGPRPRRARGRRAAPGRVAGLGLPPGGPSAGGGLHPRLLEPLRGGRRALHAPPPSRIDICRRAVPGEAHGRPAGLPPSGQRRVLSPSRRLGRRAPRAGARPRPSAAVAAPRDAPLRAAPRARRRGGGGPRRRGQLRHAPRRAPGGGPLGRAGGRRPRPRGGGPLPRRGARPRRAAPRPRLARRIPLPRGALGGARVSAWLDEAAAIGDALAAQAVWADDACNWLTRRVPHLMSVPTEPVAALETLGPSVYNGTAGVALALGRLARATGDAAHERAAQGALAHALAHAWAADATPLGKVGSDWRFGVYGGTLGVACVARELGRPEAARAILARLAESGEPPEHDIIFGSAGAILALLGMDDAPEALPLARRLGEGLLSWKPTLTGLSHGASGGALALAALHGATGEPRFREGALALFQWERDRFDAQEGNWPNYQAEPKGGRHPCATAWCHGAPGIGLARVQAWPHL